MGRLIDADKLSADMYHEAFEKDSDMQKWDSGCWIRYKMFENVLKAQPTVEAPDINVGSIDTTTHDSIPAETGKNDGDGTSGDCISRQAAIDALKEKVFHNLSDEFYGAMQVLDELPSAQPETAKRIVGKSRDGMTLWYQCDMCNEPVDAQDNYCRGCGRRLIDETD